VNPLSIIGRRAIKDYKLQGTNWFLDPFLYNAFKSIGRYPSKDGLDVSPTNRQETYIER
jgi:hypothetical protein